MSLQSFASILWVIMLQSRHFAAGNMEGMESQTYLPAFTSMTNCIRIAAPIINGMVPQALYYKPPQQPPKRLMDNDSNSPNKKQRKSDYSKPSPATITKVLCHEIYNSKMETAMKPFVSRPKLPTVGNLCKAAKTWSNELFPGRKRLCIRAQL